MFQRYVAIGDSTSEGMDDPDGAGGYRGWADRFAAHVARRSPATAWNMRTWRSAGAATAAHPDEQLRSRSASTRPRHRRRRHERHPARLVRRRPPSAARLRDAGGPGPQGATVLTFTLPDPVPVMPIAKPLRGRVVALNDAIREASAPTAGRSCWTSAPTRSPPIPGCGARTACTRTPPGTTGSRSALAHAAGLPGIRRLVDLPAACPASPAGRGRRRRAEALGRRHLLPWVGRHLRGRSSGDNRFPKRPDPAPVEPPGA